MTELKSVEERKDELGDLLRSYEKQLKSVLPKHMTVERVLRISYNLVRRNPKLAKCNPQSFIGAMLEASYLGLEMGVQGQCWPVPFKVKGEYTVVLMAGYRGLCQLVLRSGQVDVLYATAVFDCDMFEHQDYPVVLNHKRNEDDEPKALVGAYTIHALIDGREVPTYCNKGQIMAVKSRSHAAKKDDSPWNSPVIHERAWMWRKTALKQVCKILPTSPSYLRLAELDDQHHIGEDQHLEDTFDAMTQAERTLPEPQEKE